VEAFAFTTNYEQVWCYCLEDREVKLFRVSRIGAVEMLPEPWLHKAEHVEGFIDIFRIHSNRKLPIQLKLGLRATSLLTEEFPLAAPQLQKLTDNQWLLKTEVCSYEGVGRFVLGLPGEIEIIESPEFLDYISRQHDKMKDTFLIG
jgi:predicted DNA-binding transcriptional regulator YafY